GPVQQAFHIGAGASATPGLVSGLASVHGDLGNLPWAALLSPAIGLARGGVPMTPFQVYLFTVVAPILTASAEAREVFAPQGVLLGTGDMFATPRLAETLRDIARAGSEEVTGDGLAEAIVIQSQMSGGHLTRDDLASYTVERRSPLDLDWAGHSVLLNPPPAAGGALVGIGLAALGDQDVTVETLLAAMETVNEIRREADGKPDRILQHPLLSGALAKSASHPPSSRGTTHLSVIDAEGNAAAATVSNGEGNGLMLGETGVMLNNMLGEEDVLPDGLGSWDTNVRLSSMMAPTIVSGTDGSVMAFGSGGSNRIRTALMQVIARAAAGDADLEAAVVAPRMHLEKDGALSFEDFFRAEERAVLMDRNPDAHAWDARNMFFGGVHAVKRSADGTFTGAGDARRGGVVALVD
ncbi:MAG: gamma-glutamyltransferase, partial [Hyphomicrobiaceae bacterium]